MSDDIDLVEPPEDWPREARVDHLTARYSNRELMAVIESELDIESIDTNIGQTVPNTKGMAQIVEALLDE